MESSYKSRKISDLLSILETYQKPQKIGQVPELLEME